MTLVVIYKCSRVTLCQNLFDISSLTHSFLAAQPTALPLMAYAHCMMLIQMHLTQSKQTTLELTLSSHCRIHQDVNIFTILLYLIQLL